MTPLTDKQLSEFAAELLKLERNNPGIDEGVWNLPHSKLLLVVHDSFYNDPIVAPILQHLAKREMEKNFDVSYMTFLSAGTLLHHYFFSERLRRTTKRQAIKDENEYRAFWSALEQAVKGGK